jgi:glycosyltransferase involved in cell wall biosynthesis
MRFRRAIILVPTLQASDAVSTDALGMYDALRQETLDVEIVAGTNVDVTRVNAVPFARHSRQQVRGRDTLLIYHHSIGWENGVVFYESARCPRMVKYHNITPAHFFAPYNHEYFEGCRLGREQLPRLARIPVSRWLGNSPYSTEEMVALGADRARSSALPPFHEIEQHDGLDADIPTLRALRDESFNVLFVGRFAPNKGQLHLLGVLALLRTISAVPVRLCLVGGHDPRLDLYRLQLEAAAHRVGVQGEVLFATSVSESSLRAFYLAANAFLCMSEHEGFCVPLVEAMHLGLPVVSYRGTALAATLGDAALGWDSLDVRLYAESLRTLSKEPELVRELGERGRERYRQNYARDVIRERFLRLVDAAALEDAT